MIARKVHLGKKAVLPQIIQDEAKWLTVKPNGKEGKGRPVLIDEETGTILAGIGGALNGLNIKHASSKNRTPGQEAAVKAKNDRLKARVARRKAYRDAQKEKTIDLTNPDKIDSKTILQNRNRSTAAAIDQMRAIARKPDYGRLGPTKDFGSGAPVVAYGSIPKSQMGRITEAIMPDGERYTVQYAVVEADEILTSNDSEGYTNQDYFSDDTSKIRAIAGNGRVAGLTAAYKEGHADSYFDAMSDDPAHGVKQSVIDRMDNPVLVRVMQPKDVRSDIGDRSNRQQGLSMSGVERAKNDANRIDFSRIRTNEDGSLTLQSIRDFVRQMPENEQAELMDTDGEVSILAEIRMENAIFAKAYENDGLTRLKTQALTPTAKNIINGLNNAAPAVVKLAGKGDGFDVRDIIADAAIRSVRAVREGQSLETIARQYEMGKSNDDQEASNAILNLFAKNKRSATKIGEKIIDMANKLAYEAEMGGPGGSLFGDELETVSRNDIIRSALDAVPGKMSPAALKLWCKHIKEIMAWLFEDGPRPTVFRDKSVSGTSTDVEQNNALALMILVLSGYTAALLS